MSETSCNFCYLSLLNTSLTLHRCYRHNQDVRVHFRRATDHFDKLQPLNTNDLL